MGKELRTTNSVKRSSNAAKGFASNSPVQQKYVSAKCGRKKVPKGLKQMTPEKARDIQRKGGLARQQQLRNSVLTDSEDVSPLREEKNEQDSISSRDTSHRKEVPRSGSSSGDGIQEG